MKSAVLALSLLINVIAIGFVVVLVFTPALDIPLASYSHYKNCQRDYASVLKFVGNIPADYQGQAKQTYAALVCGKDYKTGQPLPAQDFNALFKQLGQPQ